MHTAELYKKFWAEALSTAVYIHIRVVSRALPKKTTPHHLWIGESPNLSYFRVFGFKCWFTIPKLKLKKLDSRSKEGFCMGYPTQSKGYKIWDLEFSKLIVSRDVTFDESPTNLSEIQVEISEDNPGNDPVPCGECKIELADNIDLFSVASEETNDNKSENSENGFEDAQDNPDTALKRQAPSPSPPLRRSKRASNKTSTWWKATGLLSFALSAKEVPTSFKVANSPDNISIWKLDIDRELDCLLRNRTWDLVNYTPDMKVPPCD